MATLIAKFATFLRRIYRIIISAKVKLAASLSYPAIEWGGKSNCASGVTINCSYKGIIKIGEGTNLTRNSALFSNNATLEIGNNVHIGIGSVITAREQISIGDDTLIAEYVTIRDQDHKVEIGKITANNGFVTAPIHIGTNVWVGAKAVILKGVTIGDNSVIAAGAVVTKDIPANVLAGGVPAKVIKPIGK